ncbi:MAG: hypothetical protein HYY18_01670 [Planctomycetes bacterium]|nr:hypothetical protein [Planctomycetota bacterium]
MRSLIFLAALLAPAAALAADAVVTVQYQSPTARVAAGTSMLSGETLVAVYGAFPTAKGSTVNAFDGQIGKLSAEEMSRNWRDVGTALKGVRNGGFLVINCHSSATQVGVPTEKGESQLVPWGKFWSHFGVKRPPRLGLVVLNGCLGSVDAEGEKTNATEADIEGVRCALNAEAMACGTRNIATEDSQAELARAMTFMAGDASAGKSGWDVDLENEGKGGPFSFTKTLKFRKGRLFTEKPVTFNALKLQAIQRVKRGEAVPGEGTLKVAAAADDADVRLVPLDLEARAWDFSDGDAVACGRAFRFEFDAAREIASVKFLFRARTHAADPAAERIEFVGPDGAAPLFRDFTKCAKEEAAVEVTYPAAGGRLKDANPALYEQLMTGRLRCAVVRQTCLTDAEMVVTYEGK